MDEGGYRITNTYDSEENLLKKIYSRGGDTLSLEENNYDSSGNLVLNKIITFGTNNDTSYNIREYDSLNRLTLSKNFHNDSTYYTQYIYKYDSSGNINSTLQTFNSDSLYNNWNFDLEFDESGKAVHEVFSGQYNPADSSWMQNLEILFDYDKEGRIIKMGETARFHYNADGNLDTLVNTHVVYSGYLGNKATLIDSYGNQLRLPENSGTIIYYYSALFTGTPNEELKVNSFRLSQNYPNPFNPTTTITYSLPKNGIVALKIYDILGKEIATLVNEEKQSGTYNATWDARDAASGVYFYKITAGEYSKVNKMMLLK